MLAGCENVSIFEPVTTFGFEFEVNLNQYVEQGDYFLDDHELQTLLPDLELTLPPQDFIFYLELVELELKNEFSDDEIDEIARALTLEIESVEIQEGVGSFGELTFEHKGNYKFRIRQLIDTEVTGWLLDETKHYFVVLVAESEVESDLAADFENGSRVFTNVFIHDISEQIVEAKEQEYQEYQEQRQNAMNEAIEEITEIFIEMGDDVSFYFHNLETGFRFSFNSDHGYIGASVGKVFYAHFLYVQDEVGNITLSEQERVSIQYTLRTSLDEFSHNLTARFGVDLYNEWLEEQGAYILQTPARHFGLPTELTASEAALLMYGIYHYFHTETPNAIEFRENMINNQVPFIVSDEYVVASKTGWLVPQGIRSDVAIVEAPSPYILVILSQNRAISSNHLYYFELFSRLFEEFNNEWFVIGESY